MDRFRQQEQENHHQDVIHEKILEEYRMGELERPNISWHLSINDIDVKQGINMHPNLLSSGLSIISNVSMKTLMNCMNQDYVTALRRKKLYDENGSDRSTSQIINHWRQKRKLTPPTIVVFNQQLFEAIGKEHLIPSSELQPNDGRHRLNAAYYFGEESIPIVVWKPQHGTIKEILDLNS